MPAAVARRFGRSGLSLLYMQSYTRLTCGRQWAGLKAANGSATGSAGVRRRGGGGGRPAAAARRCPLLSAQNAPCVSLAPRVCGRVGLPTGARQANTSAYLAEKITDCDPSVPEGPESHLQLPAAAPAGRRRTWQHAARCRCCSCSHRVVAPCVGTANPWTVALCALRVLQCSHLCPGLKVASQYEQEWYRACTGRFDFLAHTAAPCLYMPHS